MISAAIKWCSTASNATLGQPFWPNFRPRNGRNLSRAVSNNGSSRFLPRPVYHRAIRLPAFTAPADVRRAGLAQATTPRLTLAFLVAPASVAAEPIKLKLAFHTSDKSNIYQAAVKPFVDAVNAEGKGLVEIEVYFSGALGKTPDLQWEVVRDGTADVAFVIPGQTSGHFPDLH